MILGTVADNDKNVQENIEEVRSQNCINSKKLVMKNGASKRRNYADWRSRASAATSYLLENRWGLQ